MRIRQKKLLGIALANASLAAVGCSSDGNVTAKPTTLVVERAEPPGPHCVAGGIVVKSGVDTNGNGLLEDVEVTSTEYVCKGGPDVSGVKADAGARSLVRLVVEPAGPNCSVGGVAVKSGADKNQNGTLEDTEATVTEYVCNGTSSEPGDAGAAGLNALVRTDAEPPGVNCPAGGVAIRTGLDLDRSGVLDPMEVTSTVYVCGASMPGGGVLEGSVTIRNSLDVGFLASFSEITGDVNIDAPGLTTVALPALTKVGGRVQCFRCDALAQVDFSALSSAAAVDIVLGDISGDNRPHAGSILLPNLETITANDPTANPLILAADGAIDIPKLTSAASIYLVAPSVAFPSLTTTTQLEVLWPSGGGAVADFRALTSTVSTAQVDGRVTFRGYASVDLRALVASNVVLDGVDSVDLTSLTATNYLTPSNPPGFRTIQITNGKNLTLPALTSADSVSVQASGTVAAPSLASVGDALEIFDANALSLPALQTVGGALSVSNTQLSALDLPALTSVGALILAPPDPERSFDCSGGNPVLTNLNLPLLATVGPEANGGAVWAASSATLPKCRLDALSSQLQAHGWTGSVSTRYRNSEYQYVDCTFAAAPCP